MRTTLDFSCVFKIVGFIALPSIKPRKDLRHAIEVVLEVPQKIKCSGAKHVHS